jgi:hypothetical protein
MASEPPVGGTIPEWARERDLVADLVRRCGLYDLQQLESLGLATDVAINF